MEIIGKYDCFRGIRNILVLLLFFAEASPLSAQHIILNYFLADPSENGVSLSWEIKAGSTCNGIKIERSTDSLHWEEIGDIQGICGSPGYAEPYFFQDDQPAPNRINYYRLELGTEGKTSVVSAFFISGGIEGYTVLTSNSGDLEILVPNYDVRDFLFEVFDLNGRLVFQREMNTDRIPIDFIFRSSKIYFFRILFADSRTILGRFLF